MQPDPARRFRLIMSGAVSQRLQRLRQRAILRGVSRPFTDDVRFIERRLRLNPLIWGEAAYELRDLGLVMCVGFRNRLLVRYGVHELRSEVWLQGIVPLEGNLLFPFE